MTCEGCAAGVRAALEELPGVASAEVSYADRRARVRLRLGATLDDAAVRGAVATLGYDASPIPDASSPREEVLR
jgi:mercuric reductase